MAEKNGRCECGRPFGYMFGCDKKFGCTAEKNGRCECGTALGYPYGCHKERGCTKKKIAEQPEIIVQPVIDGFPKGFFLKSIESKIDLSKKDVAVPSDDDLNTEVEVQTDEEEFAAQNKVDEPSKTDCIQMLMTLDGAEQNSVEEFIERNKIDDRAAQKLRYASPAAAWEVTNRGIGPRVRNASAYITRALTTFEKEDFADHGAKEEEWPPEDATETAEGHEQDENFEDYCEGYGEDHAEAEEQEWPQEEATNDAEEHEAYDDSGQWEDDAWQDEETQ
jgi:hypothetical protein